MIEWTDAPDIFPTAKAVALYLSENFILRTGGAVKARTVAGHLQGRGKRGKLLLPRPDGGYDLSAVQDYVGRLRYLPAGSDPAVDDEESAGSVELMGIQQQQEIEKLIELKQKNAKLAYELAEKKRKYCKISDLDMEMSARGLALRHYLESHIAERAGDIMALESRESIMDTCMEGVDAALHDYVSTDSYHILVLEAPE